MLDVPGFFRPAKSIRRRHTLCMWRRNGETGRKKAGADSVLRDFKQALKDKGETRLVKKLHRSFLTLSGNGFLHFPAGPSSRAEGFCAGGLYFYQLK